MTRTLVAIKVLVRVVLLSVLVTQVAATSHAETQGGDARALSGACLCGNENGTAFPTGQCFVSRSCGEALGETAGDPCTGTGQGNCPDGQFCLDANSACGVPTCAVQTASCQGSCSTGTGVMPYEACATTAAVAVPAMPIVITALLAVVLVAAAAWQFGRHRHAATSATLMGLVLIGAVTAASWHAFAQHERHPCAPVRSNASQ